MKSLFFPLLFISVSFCQLATKAIDHKIIKLTFNDNFEKAKELIQIEIDSMPKHPKYYFMMSAMYFQESISNQRQESSMQSLKELEKYAQKAIEIAEELDDESTEIKFYLGASYGYLGRYYGAQGSWYSAFTYGKTGKNYLEEVIEEDPKYYDAYLGLGIFNYYAGRLGGFIKTLSWILGMSGDIEKGLKYLEISRQKAVLGKEETFFFLVDAHSSFEVDMDKAIQYSKEFLERNPNNSWGFNNLIRLYQRTFQYDKIKMILEEKNSKMFTKRNLAEFYYRTLDDAHVADLYSQVNKDQSMSTNPVVFYHALDLWSLAKDSSYNAILNTLDKDKWVYKNLSSLKKKNRDDFNQFRAFRKSIYLFDAKNSNFKLEKPSLTGKDYLARSLFLEAVYHYKRKEMKKAESLLRQAVQRDSKNFDAYLALFVIYKFYDFPKKEVENYIDLVDDFDNDYLESLSEQLEEKYDL